MRRHARTRSPRGGRGRGGRGRGGQGSGGVLSEEISRAVVSFGRYPDKRPTGLEVDEDGFMFLKNLMETWAAERGYSEQDVLNAVKENMFHDGGSELRFAIDSSGADGVRIKVLPKRSKDQKRSTAAADWSRRPAHRHQGPIAAWRGRAEQGLKTSVRQPRNGAEAYRRAGAGTQKSAAKSTAEKLDMPLEEIIRDKTGGQSAGGKPSAAASSRGEPAAASGDSRRRRRLDEDGGSSSRTASPWNAHDDDAEMDKEADAAGGGPEHFFIGDEGAEVEAPPEAPPAPPGPGWDKFQDEGMVWWYFAGPPAWWCMDATKKPELYNDAQDD